MSTNLTPEDYLKNRVLDQINWYDGKSKILKKRYRILKITTIVMGVSIPVMISLNAVLGDLGNYLAAAFGAGISALEGISGVLKDKDIFLSYRSTREALTREQMLYTTLSGPYATATAPFQAFVDNCERIMGSESEDWRNRLSQDPKDNPAPQ